MKRLNDLDYLKLNKLQALWYNLKVFVSAIPKWFAKLGLGIWAFIKNFGLGVKDEFVDIGTTFKRGNWAVKLSYLIFGFGNIFYGQIMRGVFFLLFEQSGYVFVKLVSVALAVLVYRTWMFFSMLKLYYKEK